MYRWRRKEHHSDFLSTIHVYKTFLQIIFASFFIKNLLLSHIRLENTKISKWYHILIIIIEISLKLKVEKYLALC